MKQIKFTSCQHKRQLYFQLQHNKALYISFVMILPEVDPEVVGDPLCFDDLEVLEWGLTLTASIALALAPYSLVELTDLVVSAGR